MKRVTIVAMGQSRNDFIAGRLLNSASKTIAESEVWAINFMAATIRCDKMIAMDPLDFPGMDDPDIGYPAGQLEYLKKSQLPIVSCKKVPGFNIEEYPLEEVAEHFGGFKYFNTTVAYAIALAIYQGFEEIQLFGCDFTYPDKHAAESGRACAEFWLGVAVARGIRIVIASSSNLMDQDTGRPLYGYPTQ
jgi:hypothetical protein